MPRPVSFIHTADWHLTSGPMFEDTMRVLSFIVDTADKLGVDGILHGGDWFHHDLPHRVATAEERNGIRALIRRSRVPFYTTYGNHDIVGDLECFADIEDTEGPHCFVARTPGISNERRFDLLTVPYPQKKHLVAQAGNVAIESSRQEYNRRLIEAVRAGCAHRPRYVDKPLIGLGHINIAGSTVGGGEQLIGHEIELTPQELEELGCDYFALGHIHIAQPMTETAWYAGTPQAQTFSDTKVNVVLLVTIEPGRKPQIELLETPAVRFATVAVRWEAGHWYVGEGKDISARLELNDYLPPAGRFRLRIKAHSAEGDTPAYDVLERWAADVRADAWRIERHVRVAQRSRGVDIAQHATVNDKLVAYWGTLDPAPDDATKIAALELAEELANA